MSQDLFAAFGVPEAAKSSNDIWRVSSRSHETNGINVVENIEDDDDDFGDFEDAPMPSKTQENVANPSKHVPASRTPVFPPKASGVKPTKPDDDPRIGKHPFAAHMDLLFSADDDDYDAGEDDLEDLSRNPEAAMAYSKRVLNEQMAAQTRNQPSQDFTKPRKAQHASDLPNRTIREKHEHKQERPAKDPNVLFDADDVTDDESEEEDFGDFENASGDSSITASAAKASGNSLDMPNMDLLGLSNEPTLSNPPLSSQPRHAEPHREAHTILETTQDSSFAWPPSSEPENHPEPPPEIDSTSTLISNLSSWLSSQSQPQSSPPILSPPTNIPPPSLLLSLFPSLLTSARDLLLDPISKLPPQTRQQLSSHPTISTFLQLHLNSSLVLAHILAGRKSRWKRDKFLAQSMRIGPSAAGGGKGGMKLAGVDKSEVSKEEREVVEALRIWKGQVKKLRGVVGGITSSSSSSSTAGGGTKLPSVPEISEQMPVKTLKGVEGGIVAPQACALCGLKREERVVKVDVDVDDSFGEWWVESAGMHLVCRDFWVRYRDELRSR